MLIDPDPQATNTTRVYGFELHGPDDGDLAGIFDGTEVFRVLLWAGDSRAPDWQSDSAAVWATGTDFNTPGSRLVVEMTVSRLAIESLPEGTYNLQVMLNPNVDDIEVWSGQIRLVSAAGTAPAPATYATFEDLEDEYPGIADLQELGLDQTGFAEERGWARQQVDQTLLARAQTELDQDDRLGVWDQPRRDALESLEDHLAANRLQVTTELRRICALYTLGRILARQTGQEKSQQGVRYLAEARWGLVGYRGRIDADGDGVYELTIA